MSQGSEGASERSNPSGMEVVFASEKAGEVERAAESAAKSDSPVGDVIPPDVMTVSYTHLTLPTIYSV